MARAAYESAKGIVVTYIAGRAPEYSIGYLSGGFGGTYASAAAASLPDTIQSFPNSSAVDGTYWVPVYTTDGDIAMVACTESSYPPGTLASYVIYYNTNGSGASLQTNYLTDHNLFMGTTASSWKLVE